jgi:hypothetical protein
MAACDNGHGSLVMLGSMLPVVSIRIARPEWSIVFFNVLNRAFGMVQTSYCSSDYCRWDKCRTCSWSSLDLSLLGS